jgi:two-component system phosphate regulon sensor histidine kinase PhoR
VQLLNLAAENLFGIRSEQALGQSFVQVVRHHQLVELWENARETGEEQVAAYEFGPHQVFLQVIAIPFDVTLQGNVLLVLQDLTRLRRLETVRRDFLSNISHELRTPLASLRALVETLLEGGLEDQPAARRFLGQMETEVDSLTQMVQELLELTRIESGRVPLQLENIAPGDLLRSAVERLQLQAERAGLEITLDSPDDLPPVLADPQRLEQVLVNLLHNAIKFTPSGGEIRLAAEIRDNDILFTVADTGVGIPADELPRIFERFYKTDRARSGRGTGLGLAIARHLVQAHGGQIWGESVEGAGSTFYFRIPSGANNA